MTTLSQMIINTRRILDDVNSDAASDPRWTDDEVTLAINRAQRLVVNTLFAAGDPRIRSSTTGTINNSGQVTIPSADRLVAVWSTTPGSGTFFKLSPGNGLNISLTNVFPTTTVKVDYIATTTSPATGADIVTYAGKDLDDPVVDQYCAYLAADDLRVKDYMTGGDNPLISKKLAELEMFIQQKDNPTVLVVPTTTLGVSAGYNAIFRGIYYFQQDRTTIQVYR